jgi:hypothetical protein
MLAEQEPRPQNSERIAPASTIHTAYQRICTLDETACIAMGEIGENPLSPTLNCFKKILESIVDVAFGHFLLPGRVASERFIW